MYIIHGAFMVHTLFAIRFIGILVRFWCGIYAWLAQTFLQLFFIFEPAKAKDGCKLL
jgi:hypothetical protein